MAKDLNKVMLTGFLGADPEMRYTPQGSAVTTFRVASGRNWKSQDGTQHDDTEWFRVVAWDKLGEICNQYLTKGTRVYVEGRLQTRKWQDQNGADRYSTEVIAADMIILSSRDRVESGTAGDEPELEPAPVRSNGAAPQGALPARNGGGQARAAAANGNGNGSARPAASRAPARNVPQTVDADEDLPF
jgi:single-strand DNA-binding protein